MGREMAIGGAPRLSPPTGWPSRVEEEATSRGPEQRDQRAVSVRASPRAGAAARSQQEGEDYTHQDIFVTALRVKIQISAPVSAECRLLVLDHFCAGCRRYGTGGRNGSDTDFFHFYHVLLRIKVNCETSSNASL